MLKKVLSIVLNLQNQKINPLKLEIACGPKKQNEKGIQK